MKKKLKYWQKRLRLQDWDITIKKAKPKRLEIKGAVGRVEYSVDSKVATILISEKLKSKKEIERTIIHELLHLHLAPISQFCEGDCYETFEEQAIESITKALLKGGDGK